MKTISRDWARFGRRALCIVPLGLLAFACGGLLGEPTVGGESSFLRVCSSDCEQGLECISNVCTQGCLMSKDQCTNLAKDAVCTNASIEAGKVAVCDVVCTGDSDCRALGEGFRCDAGFCRGTSVGQAPGQGGGSGTAPSGASCRVAYQEYASGTTGIPIADGSSCGSCTCTNGVLECAKLDDCPLGSPAVPCPATMQTDAATELLPFIAGDSLSLTVQHGGGCANHDYALCYEPQMGDSLPGYIWLHVIHDGHGDSCEAWLTKPLRFDLSALAAYVGKQFPSTTLVNTAYGQYVFGDTATCEERKSAARDQLDRSVAATAMDCQTAADCQTLDTGTSCAPSCGVIVSSNASVVAAMTLSASELSARVKALDVGQCSKMVELQCPVAAVACSALVPDCVQGKCEQSSRTN